MTPRYPRVVVLGAGTMGAQIACLLSGAGSRVRLLDLDSATASAGLERATKLRPSPLYLAADARSIRTGGFDELADAVHETDWVLEAIVERREPKRELLARVDAALAAAGRDPYPVVSTNTSGLSIGGLTEGRSDAFRRAFCGTHFFNPPRYTRLLELVPVPDTSPGALGTLAEFASRHLGKGTVVARDTPAFIANRLGVHGMLAALRAAQELGLGPDEVDEVTGTLVGRPKSATFRTLDLVGIDVAVAVADHCAAALTEPGERAAFEAPEVLRALVERGALGDKSGTGFFRRAGGEIEALDLATGAYRPRRRVESGAVEMARGEADLARRLTMLLTAQDRVGEFLRRTFAASLGYAAAVGPQIADDAATVDAAMRLGFGWELGPFATLDALSSEVRDRLLGEASGALLPAYHRNGSTWSFRSGDFVPVGPRPGSLDLAAARARAQQASLPSNGAASVLELPDGILGLELHGKLNIIGLDTLAMIDRAATLAAERYDGLVIGTQAADFSAGANLALMLIEAEEGEWDELDGALRRFQGAMQAIRYAPVPVIAAPRGRTLGGGAEIVLAADRAQALLETYIGLVEVGVGLIPAGGGSTAMARRAAEVLPDGARGDLFPIFQHAFTTVASARVSTGAPEAREHLLLRPCDPLTADLDRQWADAVRTARTLADAGYRPPGESRIPVLGRRGIAVAEALSYNQLVARQISEHDRRIVLELAGVMSGGDVAEGTQVSEAHLLDLEREAFLRLLGEQLTRDRIRHTLKTGKPLRN